MTIEDLEKKLKGTTEVYPSFDSLTMEDGKVLRLVKGDKLVVYSSDGEIDRILLDTSEASTEVLSRWLFSPIPTTLVNNSAVMSEKVFNILTKITGVRYKRPLSTFTYSWKYDYWFLKAELSIHLLEGKVTAHILIDEGDVIKLEGEPILYPDLENAIKRFFILTVTENIGNVDDRIIEGLETLYTE